MLRYILKRIAELIPTTVGVILLTFVLFDVVGGSPAHAVLGKNATAEAVAAFDRRYGYDKPLFVGKPGARFDSQFVAFVRNLAKGDFGVSAEYDEPVIDVLARGVGPSLSLTVPILAIGTIAALGFALLAAAFRGGIADRAVLTGSTVLMSVNYVVWIVAGQYLLSYRLGWFPVWGWEGMRYLALPVAIGVACSLGPDIRFFRAAILDELSRPYVRTCVSKGLSPARTMIRHVLANSLIPIVTYVSLSVPFLFTGSLMLESFFGIPGLGSVSLNAMHSSDMAVVRAVTVLGAFFYQLVNLATDLLYAWLDPRVRL